IDQASRGSASTADTHAAFDRVAGSVSHDSLADGIAQTFRADQTPPFEQMLSGLFGQSNAQQKAGLLDHLLTALGPNASQALAARGRGSPPGLGAGKGVPPAQAEQVPPQAVEVLAQQAARKDPSVVDRAADFYAQHPTLVKSVGVATLGVLM